MKPIGPIDFQVLAGITCLFVHVIRSIAIINANGIDDLSRNSIYFDGTDLNLNVTEYYFDTVVDHYNFRPTIEATFNLRYVVNDQYYANNTSPVLFYAGNEANVFQFVNNSGFLWEVAQELQAMIIFAEHRYYGKSFPFGSPEAALTPINISYLTVEQAMADFNTLQIHIRHRWNMSRDTAFIIVGGSYGGNLALWLRLKNPNLWAGAIASSATPLKHLLRESNAFAKIVNDVYANVSQACPDMIRLGWKELFEQVSTVEGRRNIQKEMKLCHVPENKQPQSIANDLYGWVAGALETMVQYGYPYPTNFYAPVPGYPFKVACYGMMKETTGLGALRAAAQVYYNYSAQAGPCFDWLSEGEDDHFHNDNELSRHHISEATKYWIRIGQIDRVPLAGSPSASSERVRRHKTKQFEGDWTTGVSWGYQCCTEVYQPMPTNGITDFDLPYQPNKTEYFERCKRRWDGVTPRPDWEEMTFMSNNIQAGSNIFLTSGQLDPWRAAAIQTLPRGAHESIIVRIIENGAHHLDLRSSHPMDPPSVVQVRIEELAAMRQWIDQWRDMYPSIVSSTVKA